MFQVLVSYLPFDFLLLFKSLNEVINPIISFEFKNTYFVKFFDILFCHFIVFDVLFSIFN